MTSIRNVLRLSAVCALVTTGACAYGTTTPDAKTIEETVFASSLGVNLAASTKTAKGDYYRDIVVGTGPVVVTGQMVSIIYTGWLSNGTKFDSNVGGTPLTFQLGAGQVIEGFDDALAGVRVGGQRQLIIPPNLGFGLYDFGQIPGNSVLVFNVEVVSAQ